MPGLKQIPGFLKQVRQLRVVAFRIASASVIATAPARLIVAPLAAKGEGVATGAAKVMAGAASRSSSLEGCSPYTLLLFL